METPSFEGIIRKIKLEVSFEEPDATPSLKSQNIMTIHGELLRGVRVFDRVYYSALTLHYQNIKRISCLSRSPCSSY